MDNDSEAHGPMMHDEPLAPLCSEWLRQITTSSEHKKRCFGKQAEECMKFYSGAHDFLYEAPYLKKSIGFNVEGDGDTNIQPPMFRVTANLTAEFVQLFGPMLYSRNPVRTVRPRLVPDIPASAFGLPDPAMITPEMAQQMPPEQLMMAQSFIEAQQQQAQQQQHSQIVAMLMEKLLNYTPNELNLKGESRKSITEGLIKGRAVMWIETFTPPNSTAKMIGSFYDSVDNLFIDPDAETLRDAKWIARRCIHPTWEVERTYGLSPGSLKGNRESLGQSTAVENTQAFDQRNRGQTQDLLVYYKVWSRMGMGRFKGSLQNLREEFDRFGDYVYLVIAQNCPCPLNLPHELMEADESVPEVEDALRAALSWPIPFWGDSVTPWPCAILDFHDVPRQVWPMAHLTSAMVYQKFMDWGYSMLMSKIWRTHRDLILCDQASSEEAKDALSTGDDQTIVPIKRTGSGALEDFFKVAQMPPMNKDTWDVLSKVESLFQRATGQNDVMYAETNRQMRSAEEASLKGDFVRLRPDDMAQCVEDWQTELARKEALASRWMLTAEDIAPVLGPLAAAAWQQSVESTDIQYVVRELEYRIEAGSTRKPNADLEMANSNDASQFVFPHLVAAWQATGDPTAANAFLKYWAKPRQLDVTPFQLPPLVIAPPPPGPEQQPEQQQQQKKEG